MNSNLLYEQRWEKYSSGRIHPPFDEGSIQHKLLVSEMTDTEPVLTVDKKAELGRKIISDLPFQLKFQNAGRFIAVFLNGEIIAITNTLEELDSILEEKQMSGDYYLGEIGKDSIGRMN